MGILAGILNVIPYVGSIVQAIEGLFGKGNGTAKKEAAMTLVTSGLGSYSAFVQGSTGAVKDTTAVNTAVSKLVDDTVELYNALGIFTHK